MKTVYAKTPRWCLGFQPGYVDVRCDCGRTHAAWFGPTDHSLNTTEDFLRHELVRSWDEFGARRASA